MLAHRILGDNASAEVKERLMGFLSSVPDRNISPSRRQLTRERARIRSVLDAMDVNQEDEKKVCARYVLMYEPFAGRSRRSNTQYVSGPV